MPCASPCKNCDRKGLPILFTRYAAAYSAPPTYDQAEGKNMATLKALKPKGNFQAVPGNVSLKETVYNVRMLRPGYLYIRMINPCYSSPVWRGYVVHPHGYLGQFDISQPEKAESHPACEMETRGANMSLVWVEDAESITEFHYMFHPDPINFEHLKKEIEPNREKYMQRFDLSGWAGGSTEQKNTCKPSQLNELVMEFKALDNPDVQSAGCEQHFGLMGDTPAVRQWGDYEEQRHGRHYEREVQEKRNLDGSISRTTPTTPAPMMTVGPYVAQVRQPTYEAAHGPRLKKMVQFLQEKKGAVVACDDPIGIAQELSLHHLTAASPYIAWLKEEDDKKVSNHWKQAVSASIRTMEAALEKRILEPYDTVTSRIQEQRDFKKAYRTPDLNTDQAKVLQESPHLQEMRELEQRKVEAMDAHLYSRQSDRKFLHGSARVQVDAACDRALIEKFDNTHLAELKKRDALMDKISIDLRQWLDAEKFKNSLNCYSKTAGIESGDGVRFAGQVLAILRQMASTPKGQEWYAQLKLFTPSDRNLVWRVLTLNNTEISNELKIALDQLDSPLIFDESQQKKEDFAKSLKKWEKSVSGLSKMAEASDKIAKEYERILNGGVVDGKLGSPKLQIVGSFFQIGKSAYDGPVGILPAAFLAWLKTQPGQFLIESIARAQLITLIYEKGTSALKFIQSEQAISRVSNEKIAGYIAPMARRATSWASDVGSRLKGKSTPFGIKAFASILTIKNRSNQADQARSYIERAGDLSAFIGDWRQLAVDRYEKTILTGTPDVLNSSSSLQNPGTLADSKLRSLKAGAARYVVAGSIVGVFFDITDGVKKLKEKEFELMTSYFVRAGAGGGTIATTIVGVRYAAAPIWLLRTTIFLAILSIALTIIISHYKGDAWVEWLQSTPFRKNSSSKIPYPDEKETMRNFSEIILDM